MAKYGDLEARPDDGQNEFSDIIKSRSDEHNDIEENLYQMDKRSIFQEWETTHQ